MRHIYLYTLTFLVLLTGFCSCQSEDSIVNDPQLGVYVAVDFSEGARTRYVSDEDKINSLRAIYFKGGIYHSTQNLLIPAIEGDRTRDCLLIDCPSGTDIQIVVIANAPANTINKSQYTGKTVEEVRALISVSLPAGSNSFWQANTPKIGDDEIIPMYAITDIVHVPEYSDIKAMYEALPEGTKLFVNDRREPDEIGTTYDLVRMVAKITICNKETPTQGRKKFKISEFQLKRAKSSGFIGYEQSNWSYAQKRVVYSTATTGALVDGDPVGIDPFSSSGEQIIQFYLFETDVVKDDASSTENCHIILAGKVENNTSDTEFLLSIPLVDINDATIVNVEKPGPVLRNHHYKFTIEGVTNVKEIKATIEVQNWTDREFDVNFE